MFAKVFEQIFDSSIASDYQVRHMFMDLLVLADAEGVIDMTFDAIARRTNVPVEKVIAYIGDLMQPDPSSRSAKNEGARLTLLDSHRDWGWRIVNYEHYRKLRDQEGRRAYHRDYMAKRRSKQRLTPVKSSEVQITPVNKKGDQPPPKETTGSRTPPVNKAERQQADSPSRNGEHLLTRVNTGEAELTHEEEEAEVPSAVPLDSTSSRAAEERITDPVKAKQLICTLILDGKNPGRMWSPDAENRLARMCKDEGGIPAKEIADIGRFKKLRREPLTETTLMIYWGDVAGWAAEMRKKLEGAKGRPTKKEPPRWREFFQWKHDNPEIILPSSFWLLSKDRQDEYERDFQTFVNAIEKQEGASI